MFFRLTRPKENKKITIERFVFESVPGRPPLDNGERRAKSMCFCESSRTMNDGILTTCFRTLFTKKIESKKENNRMNPTEYDVVE